MDLPSLSIVVPNYNHAKFLRQRMGTIFAQTYQDFEVILLDDRSTDESPAILREYGSRPKVSHVEFNETNSGSPFKQWNKGVRLARGKYVWIAESDDYADERFLAGLVPLLDGDSSTGFAYCRSWGVTENGDVLGIVDPRTDRTKAKWNADFFSERDKDYLEQFLIGNPAPNASAVVFRRALYEQIGGADETFRTSGDWKAWAAMALAGRVAYVAEPLSYYRSHGGTVRSAIWTGSRQLNELYLEERFMVATWVMGQLHADKPAARRFYMAHAEHWAAALIAPSLPLRSRLRVARLARRMDPHPIYRFAAVAPRVLPRPKDLLLLTCSKGRWAARNYVWHPVLNWTRTIRHSLGLNRGNIRALLRRP